ncbi:MAG TPA: Gfo/Idh/MocA family oxidoreductase [Verrucomicrobiae bacterium]|jgi:predicted dehydrogenase|nr:Gfo/Idh/MocA family oxidoreductase [Verrucomicrobiae bacterium]
MNAKKSISPITRRTFLRNGAILTAAAATLTQAGRAQTNKNSKLRIFHIGCGGIAELQRGQLKGYERCEFVGFCDVDQKELDNVVKQYPGAWKLTDYREAFANKVNDFDAVIVDIPDFHHAGAMLTALKYNKHMYGQKPLVHQLDELRMMKEALEAKPNLVTQMGNQRACNTGRMHAVEILKRGQLGKPIEAYVWTGGVSRGHYFADPWEELPPGKPIPETLNWDLWNGPLEPQLPYHEDLAPRRWRAFWQTGGGQLADWGCHLLDLLYFAYDLPRPEAVVTYTIKPSNSGHSAYNQSVLTYPGGGGKFVGEKFVVHYNDSGIQPSFAALGLPPMKVGANHTMVVCQDGVLLLEADGRLTIFRKGKVVEDEPLPEVTRHNHWKDWVDNCHGEKKHLWTPFQIGWRITEPALLAVKATRFPGEELRWDAANFKFTNHDKANETILKRNYRKGFEPPKVGLNA